MGNETRPPAAAAPPEEEPIVARAHFHFVLGLIFIPFAAVVVGWTLAILDVLRGYSNAIQLRWTRLLVALVVADALITASVWWAISNRDELEKVRPPEQTVRIGIVFEDPEPGRALRIREVQSGSPAEKAGLLPGDTLVRIQGTKVETAADAIREIQSTTPGHAVGLAIVREDVELELDVVPEPVPKRGLFEPRASREKIDWVEMLVPYTPMVVLGGIVFAWGRRRAAHPVKVWRGFVLALVGSTGASLGVGLLLRALLGGSSVGGMMISMLVQMAVMLALTGVARAWTGREVPPAPDPLPPMPPAKAALQGLFYMIAGFPRVSILLFMMDYLVFQGRGVGRQVLEELASQQLGVLGTGFFILDVVLVGPLAEELLFRGYLLPRLAAQLGSSAAMIVSAMMFMLIHPHYGPFMPMVFFYGYVFAWARLRSGSIVPSYLLHLSVNGLISAMMLLR